MKTITIAVILLAAIYDVHAEKPQKITLPTTDAIFTIAIQPQHPEQPIYFTSESLFKALPHFKPGEAEIKVGAKHFWQSGVIVLGNKQVLFWTTCRKNFIHIRTATGQSSFIIGDGKDTL